MKQVPIEPGAAVEATDGRLGTVDEIVVRPQTGELAYLVVRRGWTNQPLTVPAESIESVPHAHEVRLRVSRDDALERAREVPADALLAREDGSTLRFPILEERLVPQKRLVDMGELRLHKSVDHVEEQVTQAVTRDDLEVERVPVNRPLDAPVGTREDGEWLVIPIMEEVLVVQKRLMLKEEVRIRKRQITEEQVVREVVRHERVELEDATTFGLPEVQAAIGPPATSGDTTLIKPGRHNDETQVIRPGQ